MSRDEDCRKYRKWKFEQARKLKKTKRIIKKRKKKEETIDCVDEDEVPYTAAKTVVKINYRKCKEKKKKKKKKQPTRLIRKIYKRVSFGDLVLRCIKPSIEDRMYLLNSRHVNCLGLQMPKTYIAPETASTSQINPADEKKSAKRRKPCVKSCGKRCRKEIEESELEDDECKSVCSFDSQICLAGIKLTPKDREEMKKHQREAEKATAKEEN